MWETQLACPEKEYECVARGEDGAVFDLSALQRSEENWIARVSDNLYQALVPSVSRCIVNDATMSMLLLDTSTC